MPKTTFTPGPWTASGVRAKIDGVPFVTVDGPKGVVAYIPYSDRSMQDHCESHADQKVIAAAPDLYDALVELKKWTGWMLHPNGHDTPHKRGCKCPSAFDVEAMVNAALAKAEGRDVSSTDERFTRVVK